MNLERSLTKLELPLTKKNIWDNPEDAATVRAIADGNETVPTVVIGDAQMVNPSANEVLIALQENAPELLPDGVEPKAPGTVAKTINKLLGGE